MNIVDFLPARPDIRWKLAQQMGIRSALVKFAPELTGCNPPWDYDALRRGVRKFQDEGFQVCGMEGDQFDMSRIKLGLPGRDEDIERYHQMLRNMGKLGIHLLCYNFMVGLGWYRSDFSLPERGGALVSGFDWEKAKTLPETELGEVPEAKVWENYRYFLTAALPVAEEAGVRMGLHPDDPPVSALMGIGRIFSTPEGIRRAMALSDSCAHGMTFCQGCLTTMGADVPSLARELAAADKLFFIHFRDVEGTREKFRETFHDNGPTNMPAMLKLYKELGFNGPIRVDHVPTMAGESNDEPGYGANGRLFAVGYLKGILDTLEMST